MPQLNGIFTVPAISPSLASRQSSDRCTIRAGRNLPDKEFRYLRTVIVTAAVHQGFDSERELLLLTFWHWAGISPYTSPYGFAETCVFDKQSPEVFRCDLEINRGSPYPEVTDACLPSSLTLVFSITLEYSSCPPALVCGTVRTTPR